MKRHDLKTHPEPFQALWLGQKTAEFRKDDRGYEVGDLLVMNEWDPATEEYSGREVRGIATHIARGGNFGIPEGYCMISMADRITGNRFLKGVPGAKEEPR